jgi:hypothetical protein
MTSLLELCASEEDRAVAEKLAEHGIVTDRDLLLSDDAVLKRIDIPQFVTAPNCERSQMQTLDDFCHNVLYSSIRAIQGNVLLDSCPQSQRLSTGLSSLDGILKGGFLRGSITEFAGPSNTCKTVVCSSRELH